MPSTLPAKSAYATHTLSILSLLVVTTTTHAHAHSPSLLSRSTGVKRGLNAMTYQGCFSSSSGLSDQGSYTYQTSGYCQPICVKANQAVLGLSGGSDCWCGDVLPPADSKVDDSKCDSPCNGYDKENCGGNNFWSVYLSGTESSVPNYSGSDDSGSSADSTPASTAETSAATSPASAPTSGSQTTTAPPQVITSVAPGKTVVVTMPATQNAGQSSSPTPTPEKKSGGGTNVAGVAAGVVVGVLAAAALAAGLILWIRHRKRQAAEEEYKRSNQVADFMRGSHGNEPKPPPTAYSQMSDSRLDPEANARRNSAGSIADDQDYSRRILRVANPDNS